MSYFGIPQREEGGQRRALTSDERVIQLLEQMFITLKKMELHLSILSNEELTDDDIGD